MPASRGTPLQGSRSAHDVTNADLHASDIEDGAPVYHNPDDAAVGEAPVWDGSKWVATDVATQSELDNLQLNDLADVVVPAPNVGDVLVWDGFNWVNDAPANLALYYRMYVYAIDLGDFDFLRDVDGYPITCLEEIE